MNVNVKEKPIITYFNNDRVRNVQHNHGSHCHRAGVEEFSLCVWCGVGNGEGVSRHI
jgi:hypothetical protein